MIVGTFAVVAMPMPAPAASVAPMVFVFVRVTPLEPARLPKIVLLLLMDTSELPATTLDIPPPLEIVIAPLNDPEVEPLIVIPAPGCAVRTPVFDREPAAEMERPVPIVAGPNSPVEFA